LRRKNSVWAGDKIKVSTRRKNLKKKGRKGDLQSRAPRKREEEDVRFRLNAARSGGRKKEGGLGDKEGCEHAFSRKGIVSSEKTEKGRHPKGKKNIRRGSSKKRLWSVNE